jgi:hypothetical protein
MTTNPYDAPKTPLTMPETALDIPEEVLKGIKNAWVAGLISGSMTLVLALLALSGTSFLGFSAWELIDAALMFGLTFGIYKKSRTCAILVLLYFVCGRIYLMVQTGKPSGILVGFVFAYYFWKGVVATFEYQKLRKEQNAGAAYRVG